METQQQLRLILEAVILASGVTESELTGRVKRLDIITARGCYFLLGKEFGIHPFEVGKFVGRSRPNTIITTNRYRNYYRAGDRYVVSIIDKARKILYSKIENAR